MLTKDDVRRALPAHLKNHASDGLVDALNNIPLDEQVADSIRDNFISYTNVLKDSRYKIEDYMNAVAYVTFRMMGYNNQESYARTFPERYAKLSARGISSKDLSSFVANYNKTKLVTAILEQAMIPVWLLNADVMQKAINHQMYLMENAKSEMVQMQAAKSLMETLKKPESKDINLNIGVQEDESLEALKAMMGQLAERQVAIIESGASTDSVAKQKLLTNIEDAEVINE